MARDKEGQVDKQAPTISLPPSHKHQLDLHATHAFSRRRSALRMLPTYIKDDADHYHVRCARLAQLAFFSSLSCAFRRRRRAAAGGPVGHARSLPPKPLNPSGLPSYCRLAAKGFFSLPLRSLKPESKKVPPTNLAPIIAMSRLPDCRQRLAGCALSDTVHVSIWISPAAEKLARPSQLSGRCLGFQLSFPHIPFSLFLFTDRAHCMIGGKASCLSRTPCLEFNKYAFLFAHTNRMRYRTEIGKIWNDPNVPRVNLEGRMNAECCGC